MTWHAWHIISVTTHAKPDRSFSDLTGSDRTESRNRTQTASRALQPVGTIKLNKKEKVESLPLVRLSMKTASADLKLQLNMSDSLTSACLFNSCLLFRLSPSTPFLICRSSHTAEDCRLLHAHQSESGRSRMYACARWATHCDLHSCTRVHAVGFHP